MNWTFTILFPVNESICLRKYYALDTYLIARFTFSPPVFVCVSMMNVLYPFCRLSINFVRLILNTFEVDWIFFFLLFTFNMQSVDAANQSKMRFIGRFAVWSTGRTVGYSVGVWLYECMFAGARAFAFFRQHFTLPR